METYKEKAADLIPLMLVSIIVAVMLLIMIAAWVGSNKHYHNVLKACGNNGVVVRDYHGNFVCVQKWY
jgi:competence protein ComGC